MVSSPVRTGLLLATAVTLVLNASTFAILVGGPAEALDQKSDAGDEHYYLALIREAAEGHFTLGNASLREHRDDPSLVTLLPLLPGILMRWFGLPLWGAVFLTDLVFPFFTVLFFTLALRGITQSNVLAALGAVIVLGVWRALLNVVNPKMILLSIAAYFALLFYPQKQERNQFLLRGLLLSSFLYTYPHHFLYFAAFEGCDFLRRLLTKPRERTETWKETGWLVAPFFILGLPMLIAMTGGGETEGAQDLWHRIVIPGRLPADPLTQGMLAIGIAALLWLRGKERGQRETLDLLIVTMLAGLLVLNQSLVHGMEAMFGLHYLKLLRTILWIAGMFFVSRLLALRATLQHILIGAVTFVKLMELGSIVMGTHAERLRVASAFAASETSQVMEFLGTLPGERVILAPRAIADIVPVYTHHYVAWSSYATYQGVSDAELAKRYVLQELVEPQEDALRDRTYPDIFSVHAGNRAARARTWCRVASFSRKSEEECRVPVRTMIRNQEVLEQLEEDLTNLTPEKFLELLRQFNVDVIVADTTLPVAINTLCQIQEQIGRYSLYLCQARGRKRPRLTLSEVEGSPPKRNAHSTRPVSAGLALFESLRAPQSLERQGTLPLQTPLDPSDSSAEAGKLGALQSKGEE